MNFFKNLPLALLLIIGFGLTSYAQDDKAKDSDSKFDKFEAFSPLFMHEHTSSYHSANGAPGPEYWQNRADYKIKAELDTLNHELSGKVSITYTNNSPYDLEFIWLQLDQNAFRSDSRSKALYPAKDRNGVRTPTDGFELANVQLDGKSVEYIIEDTRMQIRLPQSLKSKGSKAQIDIEYNFKLPTHGKDRMGRVETENGWIYTLAQWYPRMVVFDEVDGWNTLPYLGTGEFYLEYGDFDYEITAPENMLVVGSGVLQNPKDVLTKEQRKRLDKASGSDETVMVHSKEEMLAGSKFGKGKNGMLTWHFKMNNSRDIAWAASKGFIWDAAKINLPNGKNILAQSVYPAENSGEDGYGRSTEYTKHAVELMSEWYPYPYEVATNVGAHEGGMEYPGLVFCSYKSKNESLWNVINHEFGHTWFPMIVGSNERTYAWLDEGLNTFINDVATEKFNNGEYHSETNYQSMGQFMFNESLDPVFTPADVIHNQRNLGIGAYYKPATALHVLRNVVLGKDRFDYALKTYINRWAYKHAQPWDFFNTMANASGEELGWFFKGWIINNWSIDQAVESIDYVDGDYTKGAKIVLLNKGEMPMPVTLKISYEDGTSEQVNLPVEIWMTGEEYVYHAESSTKKITEVEIDPDQLVPDINPSNNKLKNLTPAEEGQTAEKVIDSYFEAIGGKKALTDLKDITTTMNATIQGMPLTMVEKIKGTDKYVQEVSMNGNTIQKIRINGDEVSVMVQGQTPELSEEEKTGLKEMRDEKFIELKIDDSDYSFKLLGIDEIDNQEVYAVQINTPSGNSLTNYYSKESGQKVQTKDSQGSVSSYSDFKEVEGLVFPFKADQFMGGQKVEMKIDKIEVNKNLPDSDFD